MSNTNNQNQRGEAWSNSNVPGQDVYFTPHARPDEEARLFDGPPEIKLGVSADVIARYDMWRGGYVFVSEVED